MTCPPEGAAPVTADALIRAILFDPCVAPSRWPDGTGLPGTDPAWALLPSRATREGVAPLLLHQIRRQGLAERFPATVLEALSDACRTQLRANLRTIALLREVLTRFQTEGIVTIALKGVALAERVYPQVALRGMADVDLLVRKGDFLRADEALAGLGYSPQDGTAAGVLGNPPGYLASLEYLRNDRPALNLHLHWHPVNTSVPATAYAGHMDLERLWAKARPARVADREIRMLCPEHLVLYLCEHGLRVGHGFDRLILLCDLYWTIRHFEGQIDWAEVVAEGRRWRLDRLVYHALRLLREATGTALLEEPLAALEPPFLTLWERLFLRLQRDRVRGNSYFLHLALQRGLWAQAGFVARTFFPPRPILRQRRAGNAAPPGGKGYAARIGEVFTHLGRVCRLRGRQTMRSQRGGAG